MTPADPLRVAIDDLYAAFADQPAPTEISFCDHCVPAREIDALLAWSDLRTIPRELLEGYTSNLVCGTAGSHEDAMYYAPRLLELTLDPQHWPDIKDVARFLSWSETGLSPTQQDAFDGFARALWLDRLTSSPHRLLDGPMTELAPDDVLLAVCHLTDVSPLLDLWTGLIGEPYPAAHLGDLLFYREQSSFQVDEEPAAVTAWLLSDRLLEAVSGTDHPLLLDELTAHRFRQQ